MNSQFLIHPGKGLCTPDALLEGQLSLLKFFLLYFLKNITLSLQHSRPRIHPTTSPKRPQSTTACRSLPQYVNSPCYLHLDTGPSETWTDAYITCVWWNLTGTQWTCRQCVGIALQQAQNATPPTSSQHLSCYVLILYACCIHFVTQSLWDCYLFEQRNAIFIHLPKSVAL